MPDTLSIMTHSGNCCLLLELPRELRDIIYMYCIDYPDMGRLLERHVDRARESFRTRFGPDISLQRLEELLPWSSIVQPEPLPMQTPSILLLSRQITAEALDILHSKTLRLDTPIPANYNRNVRDVFLTDFIGEETLLSIRHASLSLSFQTMKEANHWYRTVNQLLNIWSRNNSLKTLTVEVAPFFDIFGPDRQRERKSTKIIRKHVIASLEQLATKVPMTFL